MNQLKCVKCQSDLSDNDKFCPTCGNSVIAEISGLKEEEKIKNNIIASSGNFTGTLVKGKKSKAFKMLRNIIIAAILLAIISVIIWFQIDPDAGKKIMDVLFGVVFMAFFFLVGWLFMRGKKGKSNNWDDDHLHDVVYDDDDNN